jgi:hypothetical protein
LCKGGYYGRMSLEFKQSALPAASYPPSQKARGRAPTFRKRQTKGAVVRLSHPPENAYFLSSLRDLIPFFYSTHGLRRGLHSVAASRLELWALARVNYDQPLTALDIRATISSLSAVSLRARNHAHKEKRYD